MSLDVSPKTYKCCSKDEFINADAGGRAIHWPHEGAYGISSHNNYKEGSVSATIK